MSCLVPFTRFLQSTKRIGQGAIHGESQRQSPSTALVHILDDDSLLDIFSLCRPSVYAYDQDKERVIGGLWWDCERWWYKLAHVCQRWRNLILRSPSYLGLCLFCTYGAPVADMLAHSLPLPLVIDCFRQDSREIWEFYAEGEDGINFALEQRHRVRRVCFDTSLPKLQRLIMAIDEEYPMLEYLIMRPSMGDNSTALMLSENLRAPHLRHLTLSGFALSIESRLLTTAPKNLHQWISFMPQLEVLLIFFLFPVPIRDEERQLMHSPTTALVALTNLREFRFGGACAYLEAFVGRITAPRLKILDIQFYKQYVFSVPSLLQFMNTIENLRFDSAKFKFSQNGVSVEVYLWDRAEACGFPLFVHRWHLELEDCWCLYWQVFSVAHIFNSLGQISSTVEHLTFEHEVHTWSHNWSSEVHHEINRTEWRKLLRPFSNVKTLYVGDGLVRELSGSLQLDDGELPLEVLPELQELAYSGSGDIGDAFTSFIDVRQKAGHPVSLVDLNSRSVTPLSRRLSPGPSELPPVIGSLAWNRPRVLHNFY